MDFARILHPTSAPPNNNPRSRTPKRPSVSRSTQPAANATYQHRHSSAAADIPTLPSQRISTPPPARYLASQPVQPFLPRNEAEAVSFVHGDPLTLDNPSFYSSPSGDRDYFSEYTIGDSVGDDSDFDLQLDQEVSDLRTPPRNASNTPIDLTLDSSPEMPRRGEVPRRGRTEPRRQAERKRDTRQDSSDASISGPSKRRKFSGVAEPGHTESTFPDIHNADTNVQSIDLDDEENQLASALQKQQADAVQAQKETRGQETKLNGLTCTVCLDNVTELTATSCGHAFCRKCLTEWLNAGEREHPKRSNCPACRKMLKRNGRTNDVIPLEIMKRSALTPRVRDNNAATVVL